MQLFIKVSQGRITACTFKTFGCAAAIATSSIMTELVRGKRLDEAIEISERTVAEALDGLPPTKLHCSNLSAKALKAAIEDYYTKREVNR